MIYMVVRSYYDGCDNWEHVYSVFLDAYLANVQAEAFEEAEQNPDVSYFVRTKEISTEVKYALP